MPNHGGVVGDRPLGLAGERLEHLVSICRIRTDPFDRVDRLPRLHHPFSCEARYVISGAGDTP